MPELAYVNGVFGPIAEATVSIEDRGFQFGDGVYEVIVAYDGRLFLLEPHMHRLRRSAAAIMLDYDFDADPLEPIIAEGLRRCEFSDALVYVQLTRGVAPRSHDVPEKITPTVVMTFKPFPVVPEELRQRGARMMTTLDTRWANCYVKAITLLPNVIAKNEALRRGYDDAIFVSETGEVRECTAYNLFIAKDDELTIPLRTESVLHGVTQSFLLECAAAIGLKVNERAFDIATLCAADEVFMSGTTVDSLGITSVDDRRIGDGRVGPITRRLYEEFVKRSRAGRYDPDFDDE
ncbi:MAG: aminotransferase class IV [Phycisphaerales bacterium]|nr:MAG: aminotransferase class IV [Phycisphaerales bacterium]